MRSVAFGSKVEFGWSGLAVDDKYSIRVTFLSETDGRKQRVLDSHSGEWLYGGG